MGVLPSAAFLISAALAAAAYIATLRFLYDVSEVKALTAAQMGVAALYGIVVSVWVGAEAGHFFARMQPRYEGISHDDELELASDNETAGFSPTKGGGAPMGRDREAEPTIFGVASSHLKALRLASEFVAIMGFIYLCDRTTLVGKGPKYVDKSAFWAVNGLILFAALLTLRGGAGSRGATTEVVDAHVKPLQRDQTEEWKGWMQIMFVLYHYFAEAEIYNAIRMYIAAYVWMTGFGNFSYYYIKKDFTAVRFTQMMWRLNFFVVFVCCTMNNEYMLYYICPMHTFFTWGVFIPLYIAHSLNDSFKVLFLKIVATFAVTFVLYDVEGVFQTVMAPFQGILAFHDPLHPENKPEHEWFFRSGLDHFVWIFGMFCAFAFPFLDNGVMNIESLPRASSYSSKLILLGGVLLIGGWWYVEYFALPKRSYNKVHPYTSFIPIFLYLILRNLTEWLRKRHLHLFAWCGKITLETYILQFHIWMKTTGINGSPKFLMVWLPGYYWTNFIVVSAVYIAISFRVFHITAALRDVVIPKEGGVALAHRGVALTLGAGLFYGIGLALQKALIV